MSEPPDPGWSPVEPTDPVPSFTSLLDTHAWLLELFLAHQEALLAGDLLLARQRLLDFKEGLQAHVRAEEGLLLPVYERAPPILGGRPDLFTREHSKMLQFVDRFEAS